MDALIVVDVQNDFCPGGALAVDEGDQVVEPLNRMAAEHELVVATRDWHPPDHASFETEGGPWPVHCVRDTPGAQFHPAMDEIAVEAVVDVGRARDDEGYSGFENSDLARILRDREAREVYVCGLATDYCVRATALEAIEEGFGVEVDLDGVRGIDAQPGDVDHTLDEIRAAGGQVVENTGQAR